MKPQPMIAVLAIAMICHEANRAYCASLGDTSQKPLDSAEQWQQESAIKGVEFAINNPGAPVSAQHDAWTADKVAAGWVYGPVKDPVAKTHPCIVPYELLPIEQRLKDSLFQGIVRSFFSKPDPTISTGKYPDGIPSGLALHADGVWQAPLPEHEIIADKELRKDLDDILQRVKVLPGSRERSLVRTKLEEGVMWLGMDLKRLGTPNPYPNSYNPSNTVVDPTADGLKF